MTAKRGAMKDRQAAEKAEGFLLEMIRGGEYEEITIKLRDGTIDKMELLHSLDHSQDIDSALAQSDFADVVVKKRDGRIVQQTVTHLRKIRTR